MAENLYLVKTEQGKLLKSLKKQGLVSEVTPLAAKTAMRGRRPGRPGRPPKA